MLEFSDMINRLWALPLVIIACLFGVVSILLSRRSLRARAMRATQFTSNFRQFANALYHEGTFNPGLYEWLLKKSGTMQNEMGTLGEMSYYRPPFASYMITNYAVIFNTIPERGRGTAHEHMVATCDECLVRYAGFLEEMAAEVNRRLLNPFLWLREGARVILSFPFALLKWL